MSRVQSLWFLLAFVFFEFDSVQSKQCNFLNAECMTKVAKNIFQEVTSFHHLDPVDPLHVQEIDGKIGTVKYVVTNVTLEGLRHCEVQLLKYQKVQDELRYRHYLHCSKLVFNFHFDVQGTVDGVELVGSGLGTEVTDDYVIVQKGISETYISEKDQKPRLLLRDYHVETDLKGKYTFKTKKIITGNKAKFALAVAYLNKIANGKEKLVKSRTLKNFVAKYMESVNRYLSDTPLEQLLAYD